MEVKMDIKRSISDYTYYQEAVTTAEAVVQLLISLHQIHNIKVGNTHEKQNISY